MGMGIRIYLVNEDDTLQRLSHARYERLFRREKRESLLRYACKRVRCVMLFLEVKNRKPLSISWTEYSYLAFDSEGKFDKKEWEDAFPLIAHMLPPQEEEKRPRKIIDAKERFARKKYQNEYRWEPTPELEKAIRDEVFGPPTHLHIVR